MKKKIIEFKKVRYFNKYGRVINRPEHEARILADFGFKPAVNVFDLTGLTPSELEQDGI